jgi:hypothetical protein
MNRSSKIIILIQQLIGLQNILIPNSQRILFFININLCQNNSQSFNLQLRDQNKTSSLSNLINNHSLSTLSLLIKKLAHPLPSQQFQRKTAIPRQISRNLPQLPFRSRQQLKLLIKNINMIIPDFLSLQNLQMSLIFLQLNQIFLGCQLFNFQNKPCNFAVTLNIFLLYLSQLNIDMVGFQNNFALFFLVLVDL